MDKSGLNVTVVTPTHADVTEVPHIDGPVPPEDKELNYVFIPLCTLGVIVVLSIALLLFIQRKRRLDRLRHRLMPFYNFAPGEEEDWEAELLENDGELTMKRGYNSVSPPNIQHSQY